MEQQCSSNADLWIQGIIICINKEKQYGFIQSQSELPQPFHNTQVHFRLQKVSWNAEVYDHVEFQLDKKQHHKPSAFAIRRLEPRSSKPQQTSSAGITESGIARNNSAVALQSVHSRLPASSRSMFGKTPSSEVGNKASDGYSAFQADGRSKHHGMCEVRRIGTVKKIQDTFGFICHDTIKPSLVEHDADLYFSVSSPNTGHLKLERGDQVSFYVRETREQKLKAASIRLVRCSNRTRGIIEDYIRSVLRNIADCDNAGSREHVIVAVTCLPVWECIGHISTITDYGLNMLVELLIQLNEKEFLKENAAVVLETMHKTPLFAPISGRLSCYMTDLVVRGLTDQLLKLHRLLLLMAQRVPKCGRHVTEFVRPLITGEASSCEKLLYQLLREFTKGSAGAIENMQWNELPLVPSIDELLSGKLESYSSLQRVIEKGEYPSSESYMDTYFRLLRVDCFSALAKGVTDLLGGDLDSRDMNVYRGICLAGVQLSHSGTSTGLSIGLRVTTHQEINWDQSSNLMFGNLLCISVSGTFQDPIWATVVNRDLLKKHQIVVIELCSDNNLGSNSSCLLALYFAGTSSVMVESPTYYRAYEPVLRALQNTDTEKIAFKQELVKCRQGKCPVYITAHTEFDGRIIYDQWSVQKLNALCYSLDELNLSKTTLDASQETAIKQCLRNRVAIIQGPPGTGKTFIGAKIVELLLSISTPLRFPILILTYKNHSLDEFLKEMIKIVPQSVARVGGRSQEKVLFSRTLNELRRLQEFRMSDPVFNEIKVFKAELEQLKQQIDEAFDSMEEQRHFGVDSLLQSFADEQLAVFLQQCDWSRTKQKPFKSEDESKWQTVSKTITCREVSELVQKCGQSFLQQVVESDMNQKNSLGANLYQLLKSALSLWLPKAEDFEEFEQNFAISQGCVFRGYEQLVKTEVPTHNDWIYEEQDIDETVQERLAAFVAKQTSADELLKNFKSFGNSQDQRGHLLAIAEVVVKKATAAPLTGVRNLWDLHINDRILLIQHALRRKFTKAGEHFQSLLTEYEKVYRSKQELEDQQKVNILQQMKIVGMTVTGANINRNLIAQLQPEVILVEEAAEVLEPQLVALMGNWVKHLIMIGDHKQLRPSVENYILARDYHLDLSMMERLINNGLSFATLTMQNRMRPEFASLLLDIYPDLRSNLARVESHQPANCIGQSMYFWSHEAPELNERSFVNKVEAERAVHLALFLIE